MSKLFLDLAKLKKVSSDGKTSVFEHSAGHQVHVNHKSLSPKMKAELEDLLKRKPEASKKKKPVEEPQKFAEGTPDGPIEEISPEEQASYHQAMMAGRLPAPPEMQDAFIKRAAAGYDSNNSSQMPTESPDPTSNIPPASDREMAKERYTQEMTQATDANGQGFTPEQIAAQSDKLANQEVSNTPGLGTQFAQEQRQDQVTAQAQRQQGIAGQQLSPPPAAEAAPQAAPAPASTAMAGPATMPQPKAPEAQGLSQVTGGLSKGIEEERQSIGMKAAAKAQQATDTVNALAAGQINKNMADSHYRELLAANEQERQSTAHDIANFHIKPDQYISDMTVPGKIMTGIGLILGGIGGGLTHQENPAMKFLDAQIDRNIKAQAAELGKKENLLSANMKQFGNLQSARDFMRVQMNDQIKNTLDIAAAKAGTPMAHAEAMEAKGLLDQKSGMLMSKIGALQTLNSPNAGMGDINAALQSLRLTSPEHAKETEQRLVPGVGMASVPVPQEVRDKIMAHKQLDERAKDLLDFASKHTGALDPRIKAQGEQKVLALQSLYREGVLGTVYREGEQPLLDKIVKDPTSFFNKYGNIPKLQELIRSNDARYKVLTRDIRPLPGMQQQEQGRPAPRFAPRK